MVVGLSIIDEKIPPLEEEAVVLVDVVRAAGPWARRSMGKARECKWLRPVAVAWRPRLFQSHSQGALRLPRGRCCCSPESGVDVGRLRDERLIADDREGLARLQRLHPARGMRSAEGQRGAMSMSRGEGRVGAAVVAAVAVRSLNLYSRGSATISAMVTSGRMQPHTHRVRAHERCARGDFLSRRL